MGKCEGLKEGKIHASNMDLTMVLRVSYLLRQIKFSKSE